jgi:hypothetical protein
MCSTFAAYSSERSNASDLPTAQRSAEPRKRLAPAGANLGCAGPALLTQPRTAGGDLPEKNRRGTPQAE